jgi:hypothetical protein
MKGIEVVRLIEIVASFGGFRRKESCYIVVLQSTCEAAKLEV